ncbi:uncharacterized protein LOC128233381 [Mya arenaria]|uniref:uncharacterized protein LOC128233381 n=1 Tax=Mya arenaria TaxID=6604 RepID=UPI0022E1E818|nr:uncharacterized protein LOC128233381 [Mya arenaria]
MACGQRRRRHFMHTWFCSTAQVCAVLLFAVPVTSTPAWRCFPNDTIVVENPGGSTRVFTNNDSKKCTADWVPNKLAAIITGCEKDNVVEVTFFTHDFTSPDVYGGPNALTYSFKCKEISESGEFHTISVSLQANDLVIEKRIYPTFAVRSKMFLDDTEEDIAETVPAGTPIWWTIETIPTFVMKPEHCWAYGGQEVLDDVPKVQLIQNGCTIDSSLCSNFMWNTANNGSKINAALIGFRFYGSDYITLQCSMRMCPSDTSNFCDWNCSSTKRKRSYLTESDGSETKSETRSVLYSLRITDNDLIFSSEATHLETECVWLFLVWLCTRFL